MPFEGQEMPMEMFPYGPMMGLVFAIIIVIPFWRIFSRAGLSKWLSLLMVVPVVNIITLYFLAFSSWPSLRKLD